MRKLDDCATCATCRFCVEEPGKISTGIIHGFCTFNPPVFTGTGSRVGAYPSVTSKTPACNHHDEDDD